jgi:hypothetical protein
MLGEELTIVRTTHTEHPKKTRSYPTAVDTFRSLTLRNAFFNMQYNACYRSPELSSIGDYVLLVCNILRMRYFCLTHAW